MTNLPSISVIIPMYNAEKYVGECLESILAQTFQDFEVIVVNDCSTDSSCDVVESYAPKFNGRLTLLHLDKNTGSGAVPRNTGLNSARGEYVFFADADDLLTLTALEELYTLAKDFDAEVVCCESFYMANDDLSEISAHAELLDGKVLEKPTLESKKLSERIVGILGRNFWVVPWLKLVRRDLLIDNGLFFPPVKIAEDDFWSYELLFFAKKFLHVPNIVYVWRQAEQSVMRKKKSPQETINFWLSPIVGGLEMFVDNLCKLKFFRQNPEYLYAVTEYLLHFKFGQLFEASLKLKPYEIYTAIKDEFGKSLGEHNVLISFLISDLITLQKSVLAEQLRTKKTQTKA